MASKQKRAIVIATKKPKWKYKIFMRRFSKGWDVFFNPKASTLKLIRPTYEHITLMGDDTTRYVGKTHVLNTDIQYRIKGNPLRLRTYQEAWAHMTYDVFKELGHEDREGFIA